MTAMVHIIHETEGVLVKRILSYVPRVGDEIRLGTKLYYKVTLIIWIYDEPDCPFDRVNVGVIDIKGTE